MKILIVDDENLFIQKLYHIINNSKLSFEQVYTANDAFSAIKTIDEHKPEIILTDIRMPQKNGLEIAKYIYENHPDKIVIIITGYADFDYAKEGIKYQVFDYILKPIDTEITLKCLEKAQKHYRSAQKHNNMYQLFQNYFANNFNIIKKQYIENLLFYHAQLDKESVQQQKELFNFDFEKFRLIAFKSISVGADTRSELEYYYSHVVEKHIEDYLDNAITYSFGNIVYLIWPIKKEDIFADNTNLVHTLKKICSNIKSFIPITLSIGISQISSFLSNIKILLKQTSVCLEYQATNNNNYVFFEDISNDTSLSIDINESINELNIQISVGNKSQALTCLNYIISNIHSLSHGYILSTLKLIVSSITFTLNETEINSTLIIELCHSISKKMNDTNECNLCYEHIRCWIEAVCNMVNEFNKSKNNTLIKSINNYINKNYSSQISLTDTSRHVNRNPSYVSRIIKQNLNKSFTQLITEKRIFESKKLLENSSFKVSEISEQVGYPNTRYFNRIFSEYVGMTPSDYRKITSTFK